LDLGEILCIDDVWDLDKFSSAVHFNMLRLTLVLVLDTSRPLNKVYSLRTVLPMEKMRMKWLKFLCKLSRYWS